VEEEDPLLRNLNEHPLISYLHQRCDDSVVKFSDFLTRREFHRTNIYNEYYRRTNTQSQMAFGVEYQTDASVIMCVNHVGRRDFSESDRLTLKLLRPHFVQAYRIASRLTRMEAALTTMEKDYADKRTGCILLDHRLKPVHFSALARERMSVFFPECGAEVMPQEVRDWAVAQRNVFNSSNLSVTPPQAFVQGGAGTELVIHFRKGDSRTLPMLLLEERSLGPAFTPLQVLGLTPREAEVLFWLAEGKSNPDVAQILKASVRTVHKHVEHIFEKLGVETRGAAMLKAREFLK